MKYIFSIIIFVFSFYSCGTIRHDKTSDFEQIESIDSISGTYLNYKDVTEYGTLLNRLRIDAPNVDFVTLAFPDNNSLTVTYRSDSIQKTDTLNGEIKENYFEIYFNKKNIMTGVYTNVEIDRIRLGIDKKNGRLYIKHLSGESKSFLVVGYDSFGGENKYNYKKVTEYEGPFPIEIEGKWGYCTRDGTVIIVPIFEYTRIYEQGAARVKMDGKWGLIDHTGEWLAAAQYDYIGSLLDGRREAVMNGKRGYLNDKMQFRNYTRHN